MDKEEKIYEMLRQNLPVGEPVTEDRLSELARALSILPESVDWGGIGSDSGSSGSGSAETRKPSVDWGDIGNKP
jgi:hypothetical protein